LISRLHQTNSTTLPKHIKVLDLCTGTGCIPLLTHYEFCNKYNRSVKDIEIVGVDISPPALELANKNLQKLMDEGMIHPQANIQFLQADVLASADAFEAGNGVNTLDAALQHYTSTSTFTSTSEANPGIGNWDILISNPPYISPSAFNHTTTRSVKKYEPRLALVPPSIASTTLPLPSTLSSPLLSPPASPPSSPPASPHTLSPNQNQDHDQNQGDLFYPNLLRIATAISAKILLFEVADLKQAKRVARMVDKQGGWDGVEIWRDDPIGCSDEDGNGQDGGKSSGEGEGVREVMLNTETETERGIRILGRGNGRTVVAYRGQGKDWMCAKSSKG
jgi:methylase of polypeptide subunit release factors